MIFTATGSRLMPLPGPSVQYPSSKRKTDGTMVGTHDSSSGRDKKFIWFRVQRNVKMGADIDVAPRLGLVPKNQQSQRVLGGAEYKLPATPIGNVL